jgi:hypothetical protein
MELSKEFDNVDILPIGEDVRRLDDPNDNIINMITAVYLRDSLVNDNSRRQYAINCWRNDGELIRVMFDGRDWYFGKTPEGGVPQHPAKFTRDDIDSCTVGYALYPVNVSEHLATMTIHDLLLDTCSWYVTQAKGNDIVPPCKFVNMFNSSGIMPLNHYDVMIYAHSTWIESCNEKMTDPTTSDYDIQRLTLEKSEYQSRINDMLAVKYAMLFAEQEQK